jgi:hypothetical protein
MAPRHDRGHSWSELRNSLEAVVRAENQLDSLPVVAIAGTEPVLRDRLYPESVAQRLLEKLIAIDDSRGAR